MDGRWSGCTKALGLTESSISLAERLTGRWTLSLPQKRGRNRSTATLAFSPNLLYWLLYPQALATGPGALFTGPNAASSTADLATKVKEDPLFLIRKREEEARRRLASNPVKIKQLQQVCWYDLEAHFHLFSSAFG